MTALQRNNVIEHGVARRPADGASPTASAATRTCGASCGRRSPTTTGSCCSTTSAPAARTSARTTATATPRSSGYADDVLEICDELDLRDVVFVGHSVSAMIGVLAAAERARALRARWCWSGRRRATSTTTGYVGGFTREDIDGLLESLESNYLGWSSAMAPVIMGNAGPPGARRGADEQLLPRRPRDRRALRARDVPVRQPRRPRPACARRALVLQCADDVDRARGGRRVRRTRSCPTASSCCSRRRATARTSAHRRRRSPRSRSSSRA